MRILHTSQYFLPWLGYQEYYLAREQIREGHEVLVLSSNLIDPLDLKYSRALNAARRMLPQGAAIEYGVPCHRLPISVSLGGRLFLRGVGAVLRRFAPEVVHSHGYLLPLTFQVARVRGRQFRLIVDEHQLPLQANRGLGHAIERRLAAAFARRWLLPRIDHLVPIAPGSSDWLIRGYGCPPERVLPVIPLGADIDIFQPDPISGAKLREELGVSSNELVVLYTGKIAAHKRIDLLVRALAALPSDLRARLLVVGGADQTVRAELVALSARLRVLLTIRDPVPQQELAAYFNCADVCAWPADCTLSHLEAAACGRPIIIPADSGVDDRVEGGNGLTVPVGDISALSQTLARLLRSRELRASMGVAGRKMVLARYSWRAVAVRFLRLYSMRTESRSGLFTQAHGD